MYKYSKNIPEHRINMGSWEEGLEDWVQVPEMIDRHGKDPSRPWVV
jgi:hypothetical protein